MDGPLKNKSYEFALKEANETDDWLSLLKDTDLMTEDQYSSFHPVCNELVAMLAATVKTAKRGDS